MILITAILAAQYTKVETLAFKMARRMGDSLNLSPVQTKNIYTANLFILQQKKIQWQQYTNVDSLTQHIQHIENARDSIYQGLLPADKFNLYKIKKNNLLNNN